MQAGYPHALSFQSRQNEGCGVGFVGWIRFSRCAALQIKQRRRFAPGMNECRIPLALHPTYKTIATARRQAWEGLSDS
jgi:hypothetical protein